MTGARSGLTKTFALAFFVAIASTEVSVALVSSSAAAASSSIASASAPAAEVARIKTPERESVVNPLADSNSEQLPGSFVKSDPPSAMSSILATLSPAKARALEMSLISLVRKGSRVGRALVTAEHVSGFEQEASANTGHSRALVKAKSNEDGDANDESNDEGADDDDGAESADGINTGDATVDRERLNFIMKHPTEPQFDPLRPLSGKWERCSTSNASDPQQKSTLDRFSSTDRSHFTHTVSVASDSACKNILSEHRTQYDCSIASRDALDCKPVLIESRTGVSGAWINTLKTNAKSDSKSEVASTREPSLKLSFPGLPSRKRHSKKKHKHSNRKDSLVAGADASAAAGAGTGTATGAGGGKANGTLDVRVQSASGVENFRLTFVPVISASSAGKPGGSGASGVGSGAGVSDATRGTKH